MLIEVSVFIFGLLIGSFLNVVIYRLPEGKSVIRPRSRCASCQRALTALDLIPLLSFIIFRARCRYCQSKISYQYPLIELLTGIIFLLLYLNYTLSYIFVIYLILSSLLIASAIIDLKHYIIPNQLNYLGLGLGIFFSIFFNHLSLYQAVLGAVIPAGLLLIIALITQGGMGIGDVKFIAMIGSFVGLWYGLAIIVLAAAIGSVFGLGLIAAEIKSRKDRLAFGPFLAVATIIMLLWGAEISNLYWQLFR